MKVKNILNDEEYDKLEKAMNPPFSLSIKKIEVLKASCTHRSKDGEDSLLIPNEDDTCTCKLCKRKIKPFDADEEQVQEIIDNVISLIETIKIRFVDMPVEAGKIVYSIIPMLEKLPTLYEIANKSFTKYEDNFIYKDQNLNSGSIGALSQMMRMMGSEPFVINTDPQIGMNLFNSNISSDNNENNEEKIAKKKKKNKEKK